MIVCLFNFLENIYFAEISASSFSQKALNDCF